MKRRSTKQAVKNAPRLSTRELSQWLKDEYEAGRLTEWAVQAIWRRR